jgi:hypothetical protein
VDRSGRARVTDFASANVHLKQGSPCSAMAPPHLPVRWTAPEVLEGKPLTKDADVFSFAMLMIEVSFAYAA